MHVDLDMRKISARRMSEFWQDPFNEVWSVLRLKGMQTSLHLRSRKKAESDGTETFWHLKLKKFRVQTLMIKRAEQYLEVPIWRCWWFFTKELLRENTGDV